MKDEFCWYCGKGFEDEITAFYVQTTEGLKRVHKVCHKKSITNLESLRIVIR